MELALLSLQLLDLLLHQRLARQLMLISPAEVTDRAEVDKSDFQLVGGGGCTDAPGKQEPGSQRKK